MGGPYQNTTRSSLLRKREELMRDANGPMVMGTAWRNGF